MEKAEITQVSDIVKKRINKGNTEQSWEVSIFQSVLQSSSLINLHNKRIVSEVTLLKSMVQNRNNEGNNK